MEVKGAVQLAVLVVMVMQAEEMGVFSPVLAAEVVVVRLRSVQPLLPLAEAAELVSQEVLQQQLKRLRGRLEVLAVMGMTEEPVVEALVRQREAMHPVLQEEVEVQEQQPLQVRMVTETQAILAEVHLQELQVMATMQVVLLAVQVLAAQLTEQMAQ
jgi:hypothetical protein